MISIFIEKPKKITKPNENGKGYKYRRQDNNKNKKIIIMYKNGNRNVVATNAKSMFNGFQKKVKVKKP